jgi:hypothetical protein
MLNPSPILKHTVLTTIPSPDYSNKPENKKPITSRAGSGTGFTTRMEVIMNYPNPIKSIPVISVSCKYISSIMSVGHTRWVASVFSAFCLLCAPATVLAQAQVGARPLGR